MKDTIHDYLVAQIPERSAFFREIEEFAKENQVPIMEVDSLHAMLQVMAIQKPKRILELGTAIGYSALRIQEVLPDAEIVTIERDEERYQLAISNFKRYGENQVEAVLGDALLDADKLVSKGPYDAIFIDAAKAQYEKFFEIYTQVLSQEGVLYSDNVLFKGLALDEPDEVKKKARVARKMRDFNQFLVEQENFITTTIPLGDGLAITRRSGIS
ncbi:O-methyltransferase family protein [Listeria fleischmannii 1991]|uniref:tRNA 5-hydroxyuridine methyltransferase n=3 Tax=Listeria fleischmannii TaxID=1069827 RepID=A0A2X3HI28_9LIST|nr:O-methyltransferase [Listeria fleischmannii]EMG28554.1 O-methyltransferase [Listeria fleischmannii subsp. fleischmannii LU2006-1]KMT60518.1 O-methyltransferase family protein [Listeria fleischmannii 1991]SQC71911.1 protein-L-isoaspartate O-methyltransferase [Listeria fleischmannii subsp. fleischmannii]